MQNVKLSATLLFVCALMDTQEIPSLAVLAKLLMLKQLQLHVHPRHVDRMRFAKRGTTQDRVLVQKITSETLMKVVDQNVSSTQTVNLIKLALITNVKTLVLVAAAQMLYAKQLITYHYVHVYLATLEIHLNTVFMKVGCNIRFGIYEFILFNLFLLLYSY